MSVDSTTPAPIVPRVIQRAQAVKRAAAALRALPAATPQVEPGGDQPANTPPPELLSAEPPQVTPAAAAVAPAPAPPAAPPSPPTPPRPPLPRVDDPASVQVESNKPPPTVGLPDPAERGWQALHNAEKRLAAQRDTFKQAQAAAELVASTVEVSPELRQDPLGALVAAGWSEDQLAQMLVQRAESGTWTPESGPTQTPRSAPTPNVAPPIAVSPKTTAENAALLTRVGNMESFMVKQEWRLAAAADSTLALIHSLPDGVDFALERAAVHLDTTGQGLTPAEGLAMAQGELVERERDRLEKLRANPHTAAVLGLEGSPATPVLDLPAADPPIAAEPPLTTISNTAVATPGQAPVEPGLLTDEQRRKRAVDAIRRAARV